MAERKLAESSSCTIQSSMVRLVGPPETAPLGQISSGFCALILKPQVSQEIANFAILGPSSFVYRFCTSTLSLSLCSIMHLSLQANQRIQGLLDLGDLMQPGSLQSGVLVLGGSAQLIQVCTGLHVHLFQPPTIFVVFLTKHILGECAHAPGYLSSWY